MRCHEQRTCPSELFSRDLLFICVCTCVYTHFTSQRHPFFVSREVRFVDALFLLLLLLLFVQTPYACETKNTRRREKESARNMCVKWCSIDLSRIVWIGLTWLAEFAHFFFLVFFFSFVLNVFHYCWPLIEMEDHICIVLTQSSTSSKASWGVHVYIYIHARGFSVERQIEILISWSSLWVTRKTTDDDVDEKSDTSWVIVCVWRRRRRPWMHIHQ